MAQDQADHLETSNTNTNSRRNVFTLPDDCYVMLRVPNKNKIQKRFLGPFRAVKRDQIFHLYDRNNVYYSSSAQYQLKKVRIGTTEDLIDLEEEHVIDGLIDGHNTQERTDTDYNPIRDSYLNRLTAQQRFIE